MDGTLWLFEAIRAYAEYTGDYEFVRKNLYQVLSSSAYVNVHGGTAKARAQAAKWLEPFRNHLHEAGLGQVSEILDGDLPHRPRGCIAQAWSVAELLRAAVEEVFAVKPVEAAASERTVRGIGFSAVPSLAGGDFKEHGESQIRDALVHVGRTSGVGGGDNRHDARSDSDLQAAEASILAQRRQPRLEAPARSPASRSQRFVQS